MALELGTKDTCGFCKREIVFDEPPRGGFGYWSHVNGGLRECGYPYVAWPDGRYQRAAADPSSDPSLRQEWANILLPLIYEAMQKSYIEHGEYQTVPTAQAIFGRIWPAIEEVAS